MKLVQLLSASILCSRLLMAENLSNEWEENDFTIENSEECHDQVNKKRCRTTRQSSSQR